MHALPDQDPSPRGVVFNIERFMVYDGPGIRTVVFLKGCPLRCLWCDNPESQRPRPELMYFEDKCIACGHCVEVCPSGALSEASSGKAVVDPSCCTASAQCVAVCPSEALVMSGRTMTSAEVMGEIRRDEAFYRRSSGGVTLSGGEPAAQPTFSADILRLCRQEGFHTAIETSACASWEALSALLEHTQLVYLDLKHMDAAAHAKLTGTSNDLVLGNAERILKLADEGRLELVVRLTCVPGHNDSIENVAATARFVADSGVQRVELLRYHELGAPKYAVMHREYGLSGLSVSDAHMGELLALVESFGLACRVL